MSLTKEEKKDIVSQFSNSYQNTGSSEVQVALLTYRIKKLTEHFKTNKKDNHSKRGLLNLVSQRKKMLDYLKRKNNKKYLGLVEDLGLRS